MPNEAVIKTTDTITKSKKTKKTKLTITNTMHSPFILRAVVKKVDKKTGIVTSQRTHSMTLQPHVPTQIGRELWDSARFKNKIYAALIDTKRLVVTSTEDEGSNAAHKVGIKSTADMGTKEDNLGALDLIKPENPGSTKVTHSSLGKRSVEVDVG